MAFGAVLISIVLSIYITFADMSVMGKVDGIEKLCAALFVICAYLALIKFTTVDEDSTKTKDIDININAETETLNL